MNVAILTAHPAGRDQGGNIADKPTIGIVVGGTGFTGDGAIQSILEAQSTRCAVIDNGAHHIDHLVAASLRNHLVHARCELCNHISFAVFDTTDKGRGAADALIDEGGVGRGHFSHGDLAWAEAK